MKSPASGNGGAFARKTNKISTLVKLKQKPPTINQKIQADLLRAQPIIAAHWFGLRNATPTTHQHEGN